MPETAENVATDFQIEREAQDQMALRSQLNAVAAIKAGHLAREIVPVTIPQKKTPSVASTPSSSARTSTPRNQPGSAGQAQGVVRPDGTVTAGNAIGRERWRLRPAAGRRAHAAKYGLKPRARVVGMAVPAWPAHHGLWPHACHAKVLAQTGLTLDHMDVIELNEAFAAQGLAVLRALGLKDDDARVNAWGGAIALGHPLGASGARLVTTAVNRLHEHAGQYALCTMCIGVGQGIALIIERV